MGVATRTNGVLRLLKALRHEAPGVEVTTKRLGVDGGDALAYVLKTFNTAHAGKMSIVRVLSGQVGDGITLLSPEREVGRVSGTFKLLGQSSEKRGPASAGETVALGKLEYARTGNTLTAGKQAHPPLVEVKPHDPRSGDLGVRQGAQGRRQARPGAAQAARRGSVGHRRAQRRKPTR